MSIQSDYEAANDALIAANNAHNSIRRRAREGSATLADLAVSREALNDAGHVFDAAECAVMQMIEANRPKTHQVPSTDREDIRRRKAAAEGSRDML